MALNMSYKVYSTYRCNNKAMSEISGRVLIIMHKGQKALCTSEFMDISNRAVLSNRYKGPFTNHGNSFLDMFTYPPPLREQSANTPHVV